MPQQTMFGASQAAYGLSLSLRADPLHPDAPTKLQVTTTGIKGQVQRQQSYSIVGVEADFLPTMVEAIVEGYLYGDSWIAPFNAARNVHSAARRSRIEQERTA